MKTTERNENGKERDAALASIDAALTASAATAEDPAERELQELALALSAAAPRPRDDFAAELDRRVAEGFPRRAPRGRLGRAGARIASTADRTAASVSGLAGRLGRPSLPVLAGAASVVAAIAVSATLLTGDSGDPQRPSALSQPQIAPEEGGGVVGSEPNAARQASPGADSLIAPDDSTTILPVPPEPGPGGGIAPGERERRVQRSASLTLEAPGDRLDEIAGDITQVVDRRHGFVLRSSLSTGDEGATGGSFELRVPERELQATLADLSELGTVKAQTQSGEDVTPAFVSNRERLATALAERRGLLRRLERADTDRQAQVIRERLRIVASEIRGVRSERRNLREQTAYASITVGLEQKDGDQGGSSSTDDALDDAANSVVGAFNLALRVLGVVIPIALVGLLTWVAGSAIRRRRRESALG